MTNELPPSRDMPAWNEASVRKDGFMNSSPSTLPASAWGRGDCSSRVRERDKVPYGNRVELGQVNETFHVVIERWISPAA